MPITDETAAGKCDERVSRLRVELGALAGSEGSPERVDPGGASVHDTHRGTALRVFGGTAASLEDLGPVRAGQWCGLAWRVQVPRGPRWLSHLRTETEVRNSVSTGEPTHLGVSDGCGARLAGARR